MFVQFGPDRVIRNSGGEGIYDGNKPPLCLFVEYNQCDVVQLGRYRVRPTGI